MDPRFSTVSQRAVSAQAAKSKSRFLFLKNRKEQLQTTLQEKQNVLNNLETELRTKKEELEELKNQIRAYYLRYNSLMGNTAPTRHLTDHKEEELSLADHIRNFFGIGSRDRSLHA
jgi:chromosome segregation ATPase